MLSPLQRKFVYSLKKIDLDLIKVTDGEELFVFEKKERKKEKIKFLVDLLFLKIDFELIDNVWQVMNI